MNVGWHTWEPNLETDKPASGGGALWIRYIWRYLMERGVSIHWLGAAPAVMNGIPHKGTFVNYPQEAGLKEGWRERISKLDVLFLAWRWNFRPIGNKYIRRSRAYDTQRFLIRLAVEEGVPIIIHDQDMKISGGNYRRLQLLIEKRGAKITIMSPELRPAKRAVFQYETLMYPYPYEKDEFSIIARAPFMSAHALSYIGNNYERYEQAKEFIAPFSDEYPGRVHLYGNWIEKSPLREDPEQVVKDFFNTEIHSRLIQSMVVPTLAVSDTTIHLCKPEYMIGGFITMRWAEAAAAGTPAFIPAGFSLPIGAYGLLKKMIVAHGSEMVEFYSSVTEEEWRQIAHDQREFVKGIMLPEPWLEKFKKVAGGT